MEQRKYGIRTTPSRSKVLIFMSYRICIFIRRMGLVVEIEMGKSES